VTASPSTTERSEPRPRHTYLEERHNARENLTTALAARFERDPWYRAARRSGPRALRRTAAPHRAAVVFRHADRGHAPHHSLMPLDRRAVDALGRRLERSKVPAAADMDELAALQASYIPALETVMIRIRQTLGTPPEYDGASLTATSRVKTVATIVEKLRHHETSLGRMRDVVGVRIVGQLDRASQDRLANVIAERFSIGAAAIIDRRLNPRYGYRAVHLVPEIDGYPVEVQIRSELQHLWANGMERMADLFGRQIRYGGAPTAKSPEQLTQRQLLVDEYKREGDAIADFEDAVDYARETYEAVEDALEALERDPANASARELERLRDQLAGAQRARTEASAILEARLASVSQLVETALD
jgi:ppGpp synthetase/RelA/SpoT-type nucleotidyltranferase